MVPGSVDNPGVRDAFVNLSLHKHLNKSVVAVQVLPGRNGVGYVGRHRMKGRKEGKQKRREANTGNFPFVFPWSYSWCRQKTKHKMRSGHVGANRFPCPVGSLGRYFTTLVNRPAWVAPIPHPYVISACERLWRCKGELMCLRLRQAYLVCERWLWLELQEMVHRCKLPDERKRQSPIRAIVAQGLHPHPGPGSVQHDFDDPEGTSWEEEVGEVSGSDARTQPEPPDDPHDDSSEPRRTLVNCGCLLMGPSMRPNLNSSVWDEPDDSDDEVGRPPLADSDSSSDEEPNEDEDEGHHPLFYWNSPSRLNADAPVFVPSTSLGSGLNAGAPIFVPMTPPRSEGDAVECERTSDDDMQWYTDWQTPDFTACRGEREGVLGRPARSDWLQWSLDTGWPLVDTDPSEHKAIRMDDPQPCEGDEQMLQTMVGEQGMVAMANGNLERDLATTTHPCPTKWKPMSAAKMRASHKAAKQREQEAGSDAKKAEWRELGRPLWQQEYDCEEVEDGGIEKYADWVLHGGQGEEIQEQTFLPQDSFSGSKPGWSFKRGSLGQGYYKEGVAHPEPTKPQCTTKMLPAKLNLSGLLRERNLIGEPRRATLADEDDKCNNSKAQARKLKKRKARAGVKADETQISMPEQVGTKDTSHRDEGLWAFDSANPNAWAGAEEYLSCTGADFVGVQETKVDAAGVADKEATARNIGWSASLRRCCLGVGGGNSAGVAVACKKHIGMQDSCDDNVYPASCRGRFSVKKVSAVCKGGIHFATEPTKI